MKKKITEDILAPFLIEITKRGLCCERCGYKWIPKNKNKMPKNCANPVCNSPYWNRKRRHI